MSEANTIDLTTLQKWHQALLPEAPAWIGIYGTRGEIDPRAPVAVALTGTVYAWDVAAARRVLEQVWRTPGALAQTLPELLPGAWVPEADPARAQAVLAHALADLVRANRQQMRWIEVAWRRLGSTWDPYGKTPEERAHAGGSCDPRVCAICREA